MGAVNLGSGLVLFLVASWALILTPGPDMIYVLTRGLAQGRRAGLLSAAGVTAGLLVHTLLAAFGLGVILQTSAPAFMAVKYLGAAYLIYLGFKTLRSPSRLDPLEEPRALRPGVVFLQGFMSNLFNPKIVLFFLAFLPQFVSRAADRASFQMLLLGLTFALFTILFLSPLGYFAGRLGGWLIRRPGVGRWLGGLSGTVLIGLGLRLALAQRR